ncbi:HTH-type transcriptional regulator GltC [Corynebacterium provencense]|uniref:HTH-type transcriptional regulator GltC n=1 Tax=Corynebacterium provencense TaxID=1737425 RepID=A0A2Z3YPA2_9CORY|nr:LysR substrate-binding domain-containing protein [Corynebacterium provencense]AWT26336.1 HTH-type transcriptional regulator GltC [Corynebacterium provencense]
MELHQLRYFATIVDEGSFTRAAETLFVAQPGVSAQVKRLEKEIGQPLLHRSRTGVTPTTAGKELLPHARAALAAVESGRQAVDALAGLTRGVIRLGTVPGLAPEPLDLASLLAGFHRQFPDIDLQLIEASAAELAGRVRTGRLDVAVLATGPEPLEGLALRPLIRDRIVAVWSGDHRPSLPETVELSELAGHDLLLLPVQSGVRALLDDRFRQAGIVPKVRFEAGDPRFLVSLAHRGFGVALVPESYAAGLPYAPVTPDIVGETALAWSDRVPISPATTALVRWTLEQLRA